MKKDGSRSNNVLPRLKVHLLKGNSITSLEALKMFGTMRIAEFIRKLRHDQSLPIETRLVRANGKTFGEYFIPKTKKESRISNQTYRG